jgi:fumarate reductase subunit C
LLKLRAQFLTKLLLAYNPKTYFSVPFATVDSPPTLDFVLLVLHKVLALHPTPQPLALLVTFILAPIVTVDSTVTAVFALLVLPKLPA